MRGSFLVTFILINFPPRNRTHTTRDSDACNFNVQIVLLPQGFYLEDSGPVIWTR